MANSRSCWWAGKYMTGRRVCGQSILASCICTGRTSFCMTSTPRPWSSTYRPSQMYKERLGSACTCLSGLPISMVLAGADHVLVTISTGGLQSMRPDLEIPEKYGIYQCVGDNGWPGLVRALRNVPVFDHMARSMARLCPDAWMLNLSNPCRADARREPERRPGAGPLPACWAWRDFAGFFGVPRRAAPT